eukprot:CAMPEP_0194289302 /NCGR_PEP_ID=MMETSP0169-20130528/38792_1 /TAXON_ID=218684 /ORGANISM="Corethron pennatum, Strain L29A3" /LENGTH=237 /DNA_ID=CAMNT_0039036541 /DNA_START=616 /DNA_END=1329 /DNA_ORIENTATION=-
MSSFQIDELMREDIKNLQIYPRAGDMMYYVSTEAIKRRRLAPMYDKGYKIKNIKVFEEIVAEILDDYNFIGTAERLDESLVLLRLLLDLDAGDIIYLSSKTNGGYDDGRSNEGCVLIPKPNISEPTKQLFSSEAYIKFQYGDHILYEAVNRSIDETIESVGFERFRKALDEHKHLMALANEECLPSAVFPCSENGVRQTKMAAVNCYWDDSGCGYPCLDKISKKWEKERTSQFPHTS